MSKKHIKQAMQNIAKQEIEDDMDIWMNIEAQILEEQRIEQPPQQTILAPFKRVMAGLMVDPADRHKSTGITFAVTLAVTALVLVVMIAISLQPTNDDQPLTVLPIPSQQDIEVDCLADRAYRVVYAEELPDLTTEDLKCAFIVGDMRGLDISHLDFSRHGDA